MRFEWDPTKDAVNQCKHGISFDEAKALFESGQDYLELYDEPHSLDEERFIAIGLVGEQVVLIVWTEPRDDTVRIISARRATPREAALFHEHMETSNE